MWLLWVLAVRYWSEPKEKRFLVHTSLLHLTFHHRACSWSPVNDGSAARRQKPFWSLGPAFNSFQCMQETVLCLFPEQEIGKAHGPPFTKKLSWDMETLMSRLELHKLQSLDPDHKYVLLRPHQNGSAFKELTSVGVSELLAMIKFGAFCSVFSSIRLSVEPEMKTGGWHLPADVFGSVWHWMPDRRVTSR